MKFYLDFAQGSLSQDQMSFSPQMSPRQLFPDLSFLNCIHVVRGVKASWVQFLWSELAMVTFSFVLY